jgi:transaldolase
MNAIHQLHELGQSVWLDFLDHQLISSGELRQWIDGQGLAGVTSNPTIFQKSISSSADDDDLIRAAPAGESDASVFERVATHEVRRACDEFLPFYHASAGEDGFVSIEVSPGVARDMAASVEEARRLWSEVDRPNLMVKIPGTVEGLAAIERCLLEGININITLLFSVERYVEVAEAYLRALEARAEQKLGVDRIASVASFFVSRVDTKVDKALRALRAAGRDLGSLEPGQTAIANAKLAFAEYERLYASERWRRLETLGARPQRLLWASTSPKDPAFSDLLYAEALVAPGTIDTMTKETLLAYLDHGRPEPRLKAGLGWAQEHFDHLAAIGIDFPQLMDELEEEGIRAFAKSYQDALATISAKRQSNDLR